MSERRESHLVKGLKVLGERWTKGPKAWVAAGTSVGDKALRWVLLGIPSYIAWRIVSSSWKLLGATVLIVVILALRAATKAVKGGEEKPKEAAPEASEESRDDGLPEVSRADLVALIRDVMGTLNGAHLATLATALTIRFGGVWEIPDVRALCEAHRVPVRSGVRGLRKRVSPGVYKDDLPPLPRPLPEGAVVPGESVVVAGQLAATNATTELTTTPAAPTDRRVGDLRIVSQDDPGNPARTHVKVLDQTRRRR